MRADQTTASVPPDLSRFGFALTQCASLPMATLEGATHIVRYSNPAFCRLMDEPAERIVGKPLHELLPAKDECLMLLDRVFLTGQSESHAEEKHPASHLLFWSYTMWPVMADKSPVGVILQVTETARYHEIEVAMNEALMLGSVRQHELTEEANSLNARLQKEIAERGRTAESLVRARTELTDRAAQLEGLVADRTAALRESVGELEAFSYSIAHDMRAPLRAMANFAYMVQTEHADQLDETGKDYLGRITSAAQRLDRLITDVLSYSSASRRDLKLQPVDLERLLEEAIRNQPEFQPLRAEIEIKVPMHTVTAHEPSLMQCVTNLLGNAVKFVKPGIRPKITVRSESVGQDVRLWFEDNGIGISAANREKLFALLVRLNPVAEFEGTGIGLAIVRKAVERMGGTFGVESEPGKGSRFWIQLKAAEPSH